MNKHPTKYESYLTNDLKVVAITKYNMSNNVYRGHSKKPENVSFIHRLKIGQVWLYIENAWKHKCKEKSYNSYKNCRIKMAGKYDQRPIIPPNTKATRPQSIASTKWCGTDEQEDKPKTIFLHTIICCAWKPPDLWEIWNLIFLGVPMVDICY